MDEICSESDVSLSPSQILERLQVLRQLQIMQRGKLQQQRLQYSESTEPSSSITEIVSHFSSSTSYNTFRSLLQSTGDISNESILRLHPSDNSQKLQPQDLIEGVAVLNLSQESEFIVSSPLSSRSRTSGSLRQEPRIEHNKVPDKSVHKNNSVISNISISSNATSKKQISLDDMPILSPRKDFEALILEKLQKESSVLKDINPKEKSPLINKNKKTFLRKGDGIARFGIKKNAVVIQNTKSLPWKRKSFQSKPSESPLKQSIKNIKDKAINNQTTSSKPQLFVKTSNQKTNIDSHNYDRCGESTHREQNLSNSSSNISSHKETENVSNPALVNASQPLKAAHNIEFSRKKHPLITSKGKTWAAVLTKEQTDFLRQLKQSDYYKNFCSPTKSIISDVSYDDTLTGLRHERESAEQNMFELLENKVNNESFNLENSFFKRFIKKNNLECSGESTPLIMQKCISANPHFINILPGMKERRRNENSNSDAETSCSSYTDCCSEGCSSVSCCSCKTVEEVTSPSTRNNNMEKNKKGLNTKKVQVNEKEVDNKTDPNVTMTETDIMKTEMAEMNAKLVATSELLKVRLSELEDEIETFRKENANLSKLREEVDQDRQKFYEEKATFEMKLNEEKVLSEYYLAEEKEKLSKQKQMYDRYVREIRGRLNKKDKDEVVNLKKEINDLKEEIRIKDAKSTSTIARLRNQIKLMEKDRNGLQNEVEKFKKINKRIQHSNEVTRRLTNIKYLEQINKKLNNMASKETRSEVGLDHDIKYKAYEIEKQSKLRHAAPLSKGPKPLTRAKSVPNLNVTSRYAKYFSQRDTASHINKLFDKGDYDDSDENNEKEENGDEIDSLTSLKDDTASEDSENYLEKLYLARFKSNSPRENRSSSDSYTNPDRSMDRPHLNDNVKDFFIQKSNSNSLTKSKTPTIQSSSYSLNKSKSPLSCSSNSLTSKSPNYESISSQPLNQNDSQKSSKSPFSAFNHSSLKSATVIHNSQYVDKLMTVSPEPSVSKSSLKTTLNPTEFTKSDGTRELRFPNGNIKQISADGKYSKFIYYNGDIKENFLSEGRIKYFYAETKTYHTTHADGLEVLEFPDGQVEKRYKDGSSEIRLPNGSIRYFDPKNEHVREEWRFPDGAALTVAANGDRRIVFTNGQVEVHAKDHKRREFPDGTVKLVYNDGTSETRYSSGRVRIKDKHGTLIMDSAPG